MLSTTTYHQHITRNGTQTHYQVSGSTTGRFIVLLHGLGGSSKTFAPLLPRLPHQTHRLLAVDFEGFGSTPLSNPTRALSIDQYVADLDDLITHVQGSRICKDQDVKPSPIIIMGHSLGSIVALHYAAKHPSEVGGLVLLGVGRSASHIPAVKERMLALAAIVRERGITAAADVAASSNFPANSETTDAMRAKVREMVESSNPEAYAQICEAMVSTSHQDPDYATIKCPVALVSGIEDVISPPARAEGLAPLLGGTCTLNLVKGGHQPILSDLEGTSEAMQRLLGSVRTSEACE